MYITDKSTGSKSNNIKGEEDEERKKKK